MELSHILPLRCRTPDAWLAAARQDLAALLVDHAACERKAAANAMALISRFNDSPALVDPLIALAREELEHFAQVHRIMMRRGIRIGPDEKDPYVNGLFRALRHAREWALLDRLLIASLIEARSCERFAILSDGLKSDDPELATFYGSLVRSEAGHFRVFVRLAERFYAENIVALRLEQLLAVEAQVMLAAPLRAAIH